MDPVTMMLVGTIGGAAVKGVGSLITNSQNKHEARRQQATADQMANRQFAWGQQMDRFNMDMQNRQQNEVEKVNQHRITQDRVSQLNEKLKTNMALQNHVRSLWGGGQ
ncbi:MAG: hypothetical protein LBU70_05000 [Chitinispirillales bacterium]|jgi:hypothetical protein|nr:hypothetical protein [Chitinispirillales bacterium]